MSNKENKQSTEENFEENLDNNVNVEQDEINSPSTDESADNEDETTVEDEIANLQAALEKEKKEYLFLMAEFDNFRKRVISEKAEIIKNAKGQALEGVLPILDDFERGIKAASETDNSDAIREGMELIYNKFIKYLTQNGITEIDTTDCSFNDDFHEAIATVPAADDDSKGKIIDTVQKGYMLNDKVLRYAKVVVGK